MNPLIIIILILVGIIIVGMIYMHIMATIEVRRYIRDCYKREYNRRYVDMVDTLNDINRRQKDV